MEAILCPKCGTLTERLEGVLDRCPSCRHSQSMRDPAGTAFPASTAPAASRPQAVATEPFATPVGPRRANIGPGAWVCIILLGVLFPPLGLFLIIYWAVVAAKRHA